MAATECENVLRLLNDTTSDEAQLRIQIENLGGADWCRDFRIDPNLFPGLFVTGTLLHQLIFHRLRPVADGHRSLLLMRVLLKSGVPVNATDDDGATVLHHAAGQSHSAVDFYMTHSGYDRVMNDKIRMMVVAGADLEAKDRHGNTPLLRAGIGGTSVPPTAIRELMTLGCNAAVTCSQGWSMLHYTACDREDRELQKLLELECIDIDHQSIVGDTAMHVSRIETLPLLLQHGANMSLKNSDGHDVPALMDSLVKHGNVFYTSFATGMMTIWNDELRYRR